MKGTKKVVSAVALNALAEALTHIYWYKPDLKRFLLNALSDGRPVSQLNWDEYKRNIAASLVQFLGRNQQTHQADLLHLMKEVSSITDFSHLEQLDDGKAKASKAKAAVATLRKQVQGHWDLIQEQEQQAARKAEAAQKAKQTTGVATRLEEIRMEFLTMSTSQNPQRRGFQLESILKRLFELFDLDPKASFRISGEQIDGAFSFQGTDFLLEGKWQAEPCGVLELDAFASKVGRKLDNTLGLLCAINGFSAEAVGQYASGRRLIILMDGVDLMAVLDGRIDLTDLLLRKRRHASQTGDIYLPVHKILAGTQ